MGYLIKNSDLQKIEVVIPQADMQTLASTPYLIYTDINNFLFVPTIVYIQTTGLYNTFNHAWIVGGNGAGNRVVATYNVDNNAGFENNIISSFIVNINHASFPTNTFGSCRDIVKNNLYLQMDLNDASGSGDCKLTMYGYNVKNI